jgi:hypothetical protein
MNRENTRRAPGRGQSGECEFSESIPWTVRTAGERQAAARVANVNFSESIPWTVRAPGERLAAATAPNPNFSESIP